MTQAQRDRRIGFGFVAGAACVVGVGYLFWRNARSIHATPAVAAVLGGLLVGPIVGGPVLMAIAGDAMKEDTAARLVERDAQLAEGARFRAELTRDGSLS